MTSTSKEGGAVVENVIQFIISILFFFLENVKASAREFPLNQVELCTKGNKKEKPGIVEKVKTVKVESRKSKEM